MDEGFDPKEYRAKIHEFEKKCRFRPHPNCSIHVPTDFAKSVKDGSKPTYRIYTPKKLLASHCLFYIPGTSFVVHETAFTDVVCSLYAELFGVVVVAIYHRLAPENKAPILLKDCEDIISAMIKGPHGMEISTYGIAGYSTGAYFAALLCQGGKFNFKYQILMSPVTDLTFSKFKKRPNDPIVSLKVLKWATSIYLSSVINRQANERSIAFIRNDRMNLPDKTIIAYGKEDVVKPDAVHMATKIEQAGKYVCLMRVGENHAFPWREIGQLYSFIVNARNILQIIPYINRPKATSLKQELMALAKMIRTGDKEFYDDHEVDSDGVDPETTNRELVEPKENTGFTRYPTHSHTFFDQPPSGDLQPREVNTPHDLTKDISFKSSTTSSDSSEDFTGEDEATSLDFLSGLGTKP